MAADLTRAYEQLDRTGNMILATVPAKHTLVLRLPNGIKEAQELYSLAKRCVRQLDMSELLAEFLRNERRCPPNNPFYAAPTGPGVVFVWDGGHRTVTPRALHVGGGGACCGWA